jgi:ethanolamine ammonia-lyase small subunit
MTLANPACINKPMPVLVLTKGSIKYKQEYTTKPDINVVNKILSESINTLKLNCLRSSLLIFF